MIFSENEHYGLTDVGLSITNIYEALRAKMSYRAHGEIFFTFIVIREQISIFTVELCTVFLY